MPKLAAFEDWTPPWGEDDEKLDPAKIKKLVYNLHKDKETLQDKVTATATERDEFKAKVDEAEQKDLSEVEKLKRENEKLKAKADAPKAGDDLEVARLEIALEQGFTKAQAKRLVGKTREELETDAAELAKDLGLKKEDESGGSAGEPRDNSDVAQAVRRIDRGTPRRTGFEDRDNDQDYDPAELVKNIPRR